MLNILVAGSRTFTDLKLLAATLDELIDGADAVCIIEGGARGADILAKQYALQRGYQILEFLPEWEKYGRSAGVIRNNTMVEYIHRNGGMAIYFWDGMSRGTRQCIERAKKVGIRVQVVMFE